MPSLRRALGFFLGFGLALFEQVRLGLLEVALGVHERVAAIDHAGTGCFTQTFHVVGAGFIAHRGTHGSMNPY